MSAPASVGGVMAGGGKRSVTPSTPTRPGAAFAQMAEADGNRTRQRRSAALTSFEDRGGHQAP